MSDNRVLRGGCWYGVASYALHGAIRVHLDPSDRRDYRGFRLVEEVEEWMRVDRGGCWFDSPAFARAAFRYWYTPSFRYLYLGFRLVEAQGGCDE